jgi:hypothetical protein
MKNSATLLLLAAGVWLAAPAASAHHSVSTTYETGAVVQITGIISRVEWRNPHVLVHLSFAGAGPATSERIEIAGPQTLDRRGASQRLFRVVETVRFEVWQARPAHTGLPLNGRALTLMDGTRLDVSDNFGAQAPAR